MKQRTGEPWMSAKAYAHTLEGLTLNLLVAEISRSIAFAQRVLGAETIYADADFAVVRVGKSEWMLHADHTYSNNPMSGTVPPAELRGRGVEFRLHNQNPDAAEEAARAGGHHILAPSADKPHGLREVYIFDPDGYCWVLDARINT